VNVQKTGYRRTISAEEVSEKVVMITKEGLHYFPKPFRKFALLIGDKTYELAIEAKECTCRGPASPHEHYWLPMKDALAGVRWERGANIVVKKEKDQVYRLTAE